MENVVSKQCLNGSVFKALSDANNNGFKKITKNHLEVTENFKEPLYDYCGIKFRAPIKWVNAISIIIFHLVGTCALLYLLYRGLLIERLYSVAFWGECILSYFIRNVKGMKLN